MFILHKGKVVNMFNMNNKKRRMIASVIIIILVAAMVLSPIVAAFV